MERLVSAMVSFPCEVDTSDVDFDLREEGPQRQRNFKSDRRVWHFQKDRKQYPGKGSELGQGRGHSCPGGRGFGAGGQNPHPPLWWRHLY